MKPSAVLINCGRGSAVDPDALGEALQSGRIAGAAIDVTEPEPLPPDSPLWDVEDLIITPHVAGNFFLQKTFENVIDIACKNLQAFVSGGELVNEVKA